MMYIEQLIPFGRGNAVSRYTLSCKTGLSDRHVREAIAIAKKRIPIVCMSDGSGYYQPTADDYSFVQEYYNREMSRKKEIISNNKTIKKWLVSAANSAAQSN